MSISASVTSSLIAATVSQSGAVSAGVSPQVVAVSASGGVGPAGVAGPAGATGSVGPQGPPGEYTLPTASASVLGGVKIGGGVTISDGAISVSTSYASVVHTHSASQISDFNAAVVAAAPPTTDASLLTQGTLADARLSGNVVLTSDARLSGGDSYGQQLLFG